MNFVIDDSVIVRAVTDALTRSPDYRPSPIAHAAQAAANRHADDVAALMASTLASILGDSGFRAQVDAAIRQALLDAVADKVKSAVRTMPAADARKLAGALFPDRVRA